MLYDSKKHNRRSIRLKGYDYSQPGFYYFTICTQDRLERFGEVKNETMILNDAGKMVNAEWNRLPERFRQVILDAYVIMPNHMHGILHIKSLEHKNQNTVGTGLVPVLNRDETMGIVCNDLDEYDDERDDNSCNPTYICTESDRMGTRPIPTAFYDMIGTFKSLSHNEYSFHVRNDGWPPFRKRLWQLR
ncbi:hypothetical protein JXQ70_04940, partial [bacterium]|nr:hypothetical protein [bacterium]